MNFPCQKHFHVANLASNAVCLFVNIYGLQNLVPRPIQNVAVIHHFFAHILQTQKSPLANKYDCRCDGKYGILFYF